MESPLRREQIAEATLTLVVEQGIAALTVRRVAEAVGISAAALYRHYRNKADILAAVIEEHLDLVADNIRQSKAEAQGPLDALRHLYLRSMALVERYRALPLIFLSDEIWFSDKHLRELKLAHHRTLRQCIVPIIETAQAQGEIRADIRANELFINYLGMVAMPALMQARAPDEEELDIPRQTAANWELFVHAVAP